MRDGVKLSTDIYIPEDNEKSYPVVIERTPYGKRHLSRSEIDMFGNSVSRMEMARRFAQDGIITIFQDCRGRYDSEGIFVKYINESEDGFDTLQWVYEQEWCNGKIATMGLSYAAHTQLALLEVLPSGLCGMVLDSGGFFDAYQCGVRQGGAFEMKQATWAYKQALESPEAINQPEIRELIEREDIFQWFKKTPWQRGHSPLSALPDYEDYLITQWENERFGEFWKKPAIYNVDKLDKIKDIPVLLMSSWFDVYVSSTLNNYSALKACGNEKLSLIMGPWLHGNRNDTYVGNVDFGDKATFDHNLGESWLEYRANWLAGIFNENRAFHSVDIFAMGGGSGAKLSSQRLSHGGEWIRGNSWPLENTNSLKYYLTSNRGLSLEPELIDNKISFLSNPDDPIPTIGGALTSGGPVFYGGAYDQREASGFFGTKGDNSPLSSRDDVISFETPVLKEDLLVCGEIKAVIYLSSDAMDTDVTVKLIDVYPVSSDFPEGYAMNITDGIMRARYRNSWEIPEIIPKNQVVNIVVTPFQTCNLFKKGHKLRVDVSSSNFPKYDINPNNGSFDLSDTRKVVAKNTIHISDIYPSHISIEVKK